MVVLGGRSFDGLQVVVTGANRGLGLALAEHLATHGAAEVHLVCRRRADAHEAAHSLRRATGRHSCIVPYDADADLACPRELRELACSLARRRRPLDLLVNNAAVCEPGWTRDVVRRALRTNVLAPAALSRALEPCLEASATGGAVINISSGDGELLYLDSALQQQLRAVDSEAALRRLLARLCPPRSAFGRCPALSEGGTPAYSVSKAALNALTRLAGRRSGGVWAASVCPGDVDTRMASAAGGGGELASAGAAAASVLLVAARRASYASGLFFRHGEPIPF